MIHQSVQEFISCHALLQDGERVLVAFSGGPDSACLLEVLRSLWDETAAVYVNHQLRGEESAREESFVRDFCDRRSIPLYVERLFWRRLPGNLEDAARRKRYLHLAKVAAETGFDKIALAHHFDDQLETFLLRLIRGSGPHGLAGMKPQRGIYIRPMLKCKKQEILEYLDHHQIPYFPDTTNSEMRFRRNRIRGELLPYIEQHLNPGVREALGRTIRWISEQNELLDELLCPYDKQMTVKDETLVLDLGMFQRLSMPLQKALIRRAVLNLDPHLHLSTRSTNRVLQAIERKESLELAGFLMVKLTPRFIEFTPKSDRIGFFEQDVPSEGRYSFPPGQMQLRFSVEEKRTSCLEDGVVYLDAREASFPLTIRTWRRGDRFQPLGMTGHKKVSDLFVDRKIPRANRKRIPIVFKDDRIVWVGNTQMDHRFRVTESTDRVLRIEILKAGTNHKTVTNGSNV